MLALHFSSKFSLTIFLSSQYDIWAPRPFLVAGGFKRDTAVETAEHFKNSVIVFGRYFISNPDLVQRVKQGVEFTDYDRETFYKLGPSELHGEPRFFALVSSLLVQC